MARSATVSMTTLIAIETGNVRFARNNNTTSSNVSTGWYQRAEQHGACRRSMARSHKPTR